MKKREYRFSRQSLPNGEGSDTRMPLSPHRQSEYTHMWKKNNDGQSLPRVGKVASGASRIGFWRDEKERRRSSQVGDIDERGSVSSTPLARASYPPLFSTQRLSQWGRQRGDGFAAQKGSQLRLAALGSPFQGKGLAWTLPPSYGRRCPEGAEVGWEKRCEKERGNVSQVDDIREYPIHRCAVPLPQWGRLRYEDAAIPASSKRIHAYVEKQYPRQSLPRVGKVASGASRIGF